MKFRRTAIKLAIYWAILNLPLFSSAQCNIIPNAIPNLTLTFSVGVNNATGVAFNPNLSLYYIAQAGNPGFPLQTFDVAGAPLYQTNTGFDMRGLWWNPNLNQLESNGYNTFGIWTYNLNGSGYALNTGTSVFTGLNQPTVQSVGDYNCVDNEIWYYNAGAIMKRDRATNALIGTFPLVGLPVGTANLNNNTVFYTDCAGHEIGLLDYVLKRIYFFDKTTMTYSGMSQLPAGTVTTNAFKASWANGMVWLLNGNVWYSFEVLTGFNTNCMVTPPCVPPTLITDDLTGCAPNSVDLNNGINAGSGVGNATFYASLADANNAVGAIGALVTVSGTYYVRYEDPTDPSCFSVDTIMVTIYPNYALSENISTCPNTSVTYPDGFTEVVTGNTSHVSNLLSVYGCDSVVTTNVTMNPAVTSTVNASVCENNTYTFPDGTTQTITANTSQSSTLTAASGCDSIVTTNITMNPIQNTSVNVNVCQNDTYTFPDGTSQTITASTSQSSSLTSVAGCDSIVTTNVTMNPIQNTSVNVNVCQNATYVFPDGTSQTITSNTSQVSTISSVAGCDSIVTTNVTMDPLPTAGTNGAIIYCQGGASSDLYAELGGSPAAGGSWSPALASGTGVFNPNVDAAGVYTYTVTNPCGSSTATVDVTINPVPNPGTNGTVTFCSNDPTYNLTNALGGSPDPGGTWSPALASGSNTFNPTVDPSGVYTYQFTTTCGVFSSQVTVTVNQAQNAGFSYPVGTYCVTDTDPIPVITGTAGGTFAISGGGTINASTGVVDISACGPGGFSITYTTPGPCSATQTADIAIQNNADATINAAGPFCNNDSPVTLQAATGGGTWSGPGVNPNTGQFDPSQANIGSNTIVYTISGVCGDVQSITIDVTAVPTVSTIPDTTITGGNTINLTTIGSGGNYYWTPNIWIDCYNCESPDVTPEETTMYTVVLNDNGCTAVTSVLVTVHYDPVIFVPNIFSPNSDGNNDVLYVRGQGIKSMTFLVYDRWGEKVFESTNKHDGWDGNFRGEKMNAGVFVYYLEGEFYDGTSFSQKGDVTLIR